MRPMFGSGPVSLPIPSCRLWHLFLHKRSLGSAFTKRCLVHSPTTGIQSLRIILCQLLLDDAKSRVSKLLARQCFAEDGMRDLSALGICVAAWQHEGCPIGLGRNRVRVSSDKPSRLNEFATSASVPPVAKNSGDTRDPGESKFASGIVAIGEKQRRMPVTAWVVSSFCRFRP